MSRPAVFFDRDGVVNVSPGPGYVLRWADFQFSPGIIDALKICKQRGYATVIVTSQQGVGKGHMSQTDLDDIHARMQEELRRQGAEFDAIEYCPHLDGTCTCRKPSPEMIHRAEKELDLDLSRSWLIGDHDRDIQMAANAGIPNTIRITARKIPEIDATHSLEGTGGLASILTRSL